jgi:hypothetical protein
MITTRNKPDIGAWLQAPVHAWAKWAPLAVVMRGTFLLDYFIVNVALPREGRGLTPLGATSTIMAHADARSTGPVSGVLATSQQVGSAVGIAVIGVVFYNLVGHGYGVAFRWSLAGMVIPLLAMAAVTVTLPRRNG